MPDALDAQRVQAAVAAVFATLGELQQIDDPTLWQGPMARRFAESLADLRFPVELVLLDARSAADRLEAALVSGAGP